MQGYVLGPIHFLVNSLLRHIGHLKAIFADNFKWQLIFIILVTVIIHIITIIIIIIISTSTIIIINGLVFYVFNFYNY